MSEKETFLKTLKEIETILRTLLANTVRASHSTLPRFISMQKKNLEDLKKVLKEFDDEELTSYIFEYYDYRNGKMDGELGDIFTDTLEFIEDMYKLLPDYIADELFSYIISLPDTKLYDELYNKVLSKYLSNIRSDSKMVNVSEKADALSDAFYKAYQGRHNKIDDELIKYFLEHA